VAATAPAPQGEAAAAAEAPPGPSAGPFSARALRLSVLIGTGSSSADTYLILGGGVGYYLVDGLELGLDYEAWIGGDPVMHRLSPGIKYVLHFVPTIKPYVGAFYRHTFVNDYDDLNYVGARAGLYYSPPRGRVYVGGGAVYERLLDCSDGGWVDCDTVYPELFVGISF
jgi:hypothetical protein